MLRKGEKAIDFTLPNEEGNLIKLTDFKGKKVVLYFYPKDNTPGCTKEACAFRDSYEEFNKRNIVVIGISADSVSSHKKFKEKYKLPFYLLSDKDMNVIKAYGAYQQKNVFGKIGFGIKRITFLIDEDMNIIEVFEKVTPDIHAKEILKKL